MPQITRQLDVLRTLCAQRLLSAQTRLDLHRLRTGRLSPEEWVHLKRTAECLAQAPQVVPEKGNGKGQPAHQAPANGKHQPAPAPGNGTPAAAGLTPGN